jgi:hypothetical protein
MSQTCSKNYFREGKFCVGNLGLLTFHHSHDFVTILWNKDRSITIYNIINCKTADHSSSQLNNIFICSTELTLSTNSDIT